MAETSSGKRNGMPGEGLDDMHCHLAFMADGTQLAAQARAAGACLFSNTVTPGEWQQAQEAYSPYPNVVTGFGMHPWWVGPEGPSISECLELLREHRPWAIGEIGLDLGRRHSGTADQQHAMFKALCQWAAEEGDRLISLHSVHAAAAVLDTLEATGALESCQCLFHWFSGPSDQLKRAIDGGCWFSCGPRMLRTGKGREYVKAIPESRLLLETDLPQAPGDSCSYQDLQSQLAIAAEAIAAIKGADAIPIMQGTARRLLRQDVPEPA